MITESIKSILAQARDDPASPNAIPTNSRGRSSPSPNTSSSANESESVLVCDVCRDIGWLRADVPVGDPNFGQFVPCACREPEILERRQKRLEAITGLMPGELDLRLTDAMIRGQDTPDMIAVVRLFVEQPYGILTLWGGSGNGKTLLLQAAVNELRERRGWLGAYVKFVDLLDYMRAGFAKDVSLTTTERYAELKALKVIAVDEVDKANLTAYANEFRTRFLDDRCRLGIEGRALTLFALNDDPAMLPDYIYDRLRDGRFVIYNNTDPSLRPAQRRRE